MAIIRNADGSVTVTGRDSGSGQTVTIGGSGGVSTHTASPTPAAGPAVQESHSTLQTLDKVPEGSTQQQASNIIQRNTSIAAGNQVSFNKEPVPQNPNIQVDASGRYYDPAADRVVATLQRNLPNATPEQLSAASYYSGNIMPVSAEYIRAYNAAKGAVPVKPATAPMAAQPSPLQPAGSGAGVQYFDFSKEHSTQGQATSAEGGQFDFSKDHAAPASAPLTPFSAVQQAAAANATVRNGPAAGSIEITVPKSDLHGEALFIEAARKENPFAQVPVVGETGTTFIGGMKMVQGELMGNPEAAGLTAKGGLDIAAGSVGLFFEGYGVGALAGGAVTAPAATAATVVKTAAVGTGFGASIRIGSEVISSTTEGRQFDIKRAQLSDFANPEFQAGNVLIGLGTAGMAGEYFQASGMAGLGKAAQQTATGAIAGGLFGMASAAAMKTNVKPVAESAITGAAMGGIFAYGNYQLEQRGIRPAVEIVKVRDVNAEGIAEEKWLGVKAGVETYPTKPGQEMSFRGIAVAGDYYPSEGSTLQPRGAYEAMRYTPELVPMYNEEAVTYYSGLKMNAKQLFKNAETVSPGESGQILSTIREENGAITGSIAEKAVQSAKGTAGSMEGARGLSASDYDAMFPSEADMYRAMDRLGASVERTEVPITTKGYFEASSKFTAKTPSGVSLDITIPSVSPFQPSPVTPLGQLASSYSFEKVGAGEGVITASPQQLVAAKFMTVGIGPAGKIQAIEPGKEKYFADINSLIKLGGGKDLLPVVRTGGGPAMPQSLRPSALSPLANTGTGVSQVPSLKSSMPSQSSLWPRPPSGSTSGRSVPSSWPSSWQPSTPSASPPKISLPSSPPSSPPPSSPPYYIPSISPPSIQPPSSPPPSPPPSSPPSSPPSQRPSSPPASPPSQWFSGIPLIGGMFPAVPGSGSNKAEGVAGSSKTKAGASVFSMLRTFEKSAPKVPQAKVLKMPAAGTQLRARPMRWQS